jgi:hypothetical protein
MARGTGRDQKTGGFGLRKARKAPAQASFSLKILLGKPGGIL